MWPYGNRIGSITTKISYGSNVSKLWQQQEWPTHIKINLGIAVCHECMNPLIWQLKDAYIGGKIKHAWKWNFLPKSLTESMILNYLL